MKQGKEGGCVGTSEGVWGQGLEENQVGEGDLWMRLRDTYVYLTQKESVFVYASSLSFYSLSALIPSLLILFWAFALFEPNKVLALQDFLLSNILPTHSEIVARFLAPLVGGEVGWMGFVYVFLTSIVFFRNYEEITARVFESGAREWLASVRMYGVLLLILPLFLAVSFLLSLEVRSLWSVQMLSAWILKSVPLLFAWMIFALLFRISANKSLKMRALLFSSFLTSLSWNVAKWAFVYYVAYNHSYETIYGSVSFLFFALLWIYLSWLVVLVGMRMCEGLQVGAIKIQTIKLRRKNGK